jgi:archaeal flagellar protein FlaG
MAARHRRRKGAVIVMASTSISHLIWFIVAVLVATTTAVTFVTIVDSYSEGIEDMGKDTTGSLMTSVDFINDPSAVIYKKATTTIYFYVKNTGDYDIETSSMLLVVNGTSAYGTSLTVSVVVNGPEFAYGSVAQVSASVPNLREGVDYSAWINVNGLSPSGARQGSDTASIIFRIKAQ